MKYGHSEIAGCIMNASAIRHGDCANGMMTCPECRMPVFKVERNADGIVVHYLSHYRRGDDDALCALRVDSLTAAEIERRNSISRGQTLDSYFEGIDEMLADLLAKSSVPMADVLAARENPNVCALVRLAEEKFRREYHPDGTTALLLDTKRRADAQFPSTGPERGINEELMRSIMTLLASEKGSKGLHRISTAAFAFKVAAGVKGTPAGERIRRQLAKIPTMDARRLRTILQHGGRISDKSSEPKMMVKSVHSAMSVLMLHMDYTHHMAKTLQRMPDMIEPMIRTAIAEGRYSIGTPS